jgi:hypothetical protein
VLHQNLHKASLRPDVPFAKRVAATPHPLSDSGGVGQAAADVLPILQAINLSLCDGLL